MRYYSAWTRVPNSIIRNLKRPLYAFWFVSLLAFIPKRLKAPDICAPRYFDGISPPAAFLTYRATPYPDASAASDAFREGRIDIDFVAPPFIVCVLHFVLVFAQLIQIPHFREHNHPLPTKYLQLEQSEFEEPKGPELPYTYKEPKVRVPLPDIHYTEDMDGTIIVNHPDLRREYAR